MSSNELPEQQIRTVQPPARPGHNLMKVGVSAALASAFFLGLTPFFGKQAIQAGMPPLAVVALRTTLATLLLMLVLLVINRSYFYIYPAGLLGCTLAGAINGLGSLFYYNALGRIDASLGHLLYMLYPLFVALWLWLDHQPPTRVTALRLILILPGLFLLTRGNHGHIDLIGVAEMLVAAAFYGLHLPINQHVLYDMPAPTVTFYTLAAMSVVVTPAYLLSTSPSQWLPSLTAAPANAWWAIGGLTLVTFLSRLTLFLGVKRLGGLQTALLGLGELVVALASTLVLLGERLSPAQALGAAILVLSLGLVAIERPTTARAGIKGWLGWINTRGMPSDLTWHTPK